MSCRNAKKQEKNTFRKCTSGLLNLNKEPQGPSNQSAILNAFNLNSETIFADRPLVSS